MRNTAFMHFLKSPIFIGLFLLCIALLPSQIAFSNDISDQKSFNKASNKQKSASQKQSKQELYADFLDTSKDPYFGNEQASFLFIEYIDYQCPYCKKLHQNLNKWFSDEQVYSQVKWIIRQNPVLGEKSTMSSQTAICVYESLGNEAFWQFNELLFTSSITASKNLSIQQSLWLKAKKNNLDSKTLMNCDSNQSYLTSLKRHLAQSDFLNIQSTPSWFFVNLNTSKVIVGNGVIELDQLNQLLKNASN